MSTSRTLRNHTCKWKSWLQATHLRTWPAGTHLRPSEIKLFSGWLLVAIAPCQYFCRVTTKPPRNKILVILCLSAAWAPYAFVGHSPSDSVCLCWTQSVGLCMVMLDTIRRTLYGYVGHNPSDSGVACATPDLTVLGSTTWSIKTFGGRRSHPRRSGVAPATADPKDY